MSEPDPEKPIIKAVIDRSQEDGSVVFHWEPDKGIILDRRVEHEIMAQRLLKETGLDSYKAFKALRDQIKIKQMFKENVPPAILEYLKPQSPNEADREEAKKYRDIDDFVSRWDFKLKKVKESNDPQAMAKSRPQKRT